MFTRIIAIGAITVALAACTTTRQCPTGFTAVSMVDGVLTYTPVMGSCGSFDSISNGSLSGGRMEAPEAGKEWWSIGQ